MTCRQSVPRKHSLHLRLHEIKSKAQRSDDFSHLRNTFHPTHARLLTEVLFDPRFIDPISSTLCQNLCTK